MKKTEQGSNKRSTILIADDSELNREMLTEILGDGYDYIYAEDGEQALDVMDKNVDVDMLVLDMYMPNIGGMQVLKIMRERNWLDEIPVVIISAENDDNFIKNAYYLGATDYIVKPFNAFLVQHRVKNTLAMYLQKKQLVKTVETQVLRREKINNMLIRIFSHVVELGNSESGSHTVNVQTITNMLLKRLVRVTDKYNLSDDDISMISAVSALHDIGKILIPAEILNKPGKLTPDEWEIMKSHTVSGDEFLNDVQIDSGEKFMIIAHEICRYHHERYDGRGYPDGLCGDEIPISAQAVSIADVYDALTSDRCYKKAFSHDKAIDMILGGECGAFNPLLLKCLEDISDELLINMKLSETENFAESSTPTDQTDDDIELYLSVRSSSIADAERVKKEFFADRCMGIQFEFDAVLKKVLYIKYYDENGEKQFLRGNVTRLLTEDDWDKLKIKIKETTREKSYFEMSVLVPINGNLRWHRLAVQTIWSDRNASYIAVVGQFTDVHDEIVRKSAEFLLGDNAVTGETILAMCDIFDIVRIVNPVTWETMKVRDDGKVIASGSKCYEAWNRNRSCKNCTSATALKTKKWMSKLEVKDGLLYSVLSRYIMCDGNDYVLEVAFCIDDSFEKAQNEIGFYPDTLALKNYYRDTLTKTYTRAYLDSFKPNLENADGIAVADIDEFKSINDTYGHIAGDIALKHISKVIKSCIRKEDVLIRYGGDEFLLVFNNISEADFYDKLESIKRAVHDSQIPEYPQIRHDISIGGAYSVYPFDRAVDVADKAMYRDKFTHKA